MDGIIFIARLGSTRLPNKHLIKVLNQTFIEWLIKRFIVAFEDEIASKKIQLILATSAEPANKEFEALLKSLPVKVFYGSINNIPLRLLECAKAYDLENLISIDGDDILCSPQAAKKVHEALKSTQLNKWIKTTGLALGMNVAGYKRSVLEMCEKEIGTGKRETGWGRIFDSIECTALKLGDYELRNDLRFTLDYEEDAIFFKSIIEILKEKTLTASDEEIVDVVIKNKINEINKDINDQYWMNFNNQIKNEDHDTK